MSNWAMLYDENYQLVIKKISKERKKKFSQREIAKMMKTTQKTISSIENFYNEANLKFIIKICKILNIELLEIFYLLSREEE